MSEPKNLLEALVGTQPAGTAQSPTDQVKAVAWARVSTEMQEERGLSIPEQLREIRGYRGQPLISTRLSAHQ